MDAKYNILLGLLHDITGNPSNKAASTGAIAEANIKKDGADKNDIYEIVGDSVLDQIGTPLQKVQFTFNNHPELIEDISNWAEMDITPILLSGRLDIIQDMISDYLEEHNVKSFGEGGQFESNLDIVNVTIGDKTYKLLNCYTDEQKEKGLMDVEDMESDEGALFDYSEDPLSSASFWMKNTTIALRILFINKDGVVISAHNGEPLSEELITEESEPVYWVIELNQSEQIPQGTYTSLALREYPEETEKLEEDDEQDDEQEDTHPELSVNKLYIYGSDGNVQAEIEAGSRIFSRKSTKTIIIKAKRAFSSKLDKDYKSLGRYVFNEIKAQNNRPAEYVS